MHLYWVTSLTNQPVNLPSFKALTPAEFNIHLPVAKTSRMHAGCYSKHTLPLLRPLHQCCMRNCRTDASFLPLSLVLQITSPEYARPRPTDSGLTVVIVLQYAMTRLRTNNPSLSFNITEYNSLPYTIPHLAHRMAIFRLLHASFFLRSSQGLTGQYTFTGSMQADHCLPTTIQALCRKNFQHRQVVQFIVRNIISRTC